MAVETARARAPYASAPGRSRGRLYPEPVSATRNAFRRDCDRIIHATAFRRLAHKTQVFVFHEGDHFRTRLTHTCVLAGAALVQSPVAMAGEPGARASERAIWAILSAQHQRNHGTVQTQTSTTHHDQSGTQGTRHSEYNFIPLLAVVFNLCDRRFDTRSGCMTWHLMKKWDAKSSTFSCSIKLVRAAYFDAIISSM